MKKGILQRCSRNWEEVVMAPPLQVKTEPIADYDPEPVDASLNNNSFATSPPPSPILFQVESNKQQAASFVVNSNTSNPTNSKATDNHHYNNSNDQQQPLMKNQIHQRRSTIVELNHQRRHQRESMISIRKDYSYKYSNSSCSSKNTNPISSTTSSNFSVSTPTVQNCFLLPPPPSPVSSSSVLSKLRRESTFMKRHQSPQESSVKSPISILERYDYDKSKVQFDDKFAKLSELDNKFPVSESAISSSTITPIATKNKTPTSSPVVKKKKKTEFADVDGNITKEKKKKESKKLSNDSKANSNTEAEQVKVIVAQEIVKTEPLDIKPPAVPSSPQSENINKINNKINIIFQLKNDRKNIIWHHHRRAPKKMVQKITIKEANNNTTTKMQDDVERTKLITVETQTNSSLTSMNMSNSNLLVDEPVEYLFFEDDVLVSLQQNTISFFEFNRLATLLRKGEPDFKVIDSIPRRRHDHLIDADNKFQRLCYNEQNSFPIYVEMRAKQKILDLPEMCPIAFSYCNVYYIDQRRAKFSSVHLDTVKSIINDIVYTCIPGTSYFIMAWNETSPETKSIVTGIVKYKLTPNLDLAKLASIRQFPKLNYRTKQVYCGQASQLITFGDTQVSIFNYDSGDLLMSLDLMKSYGTNLTTVSFKENYLFMVYLADEDVITHQQENNKRVIVIGVNKCEGNTFKVVHSTPVKLKKSDTIISKSITATNHLLITFSNGHVLMIYLNNFCDIHLHGSLTNNELVFASSAHLLTARVQNIGLRNFAEFFFAAS